MRKYNLLNTEAGVRAEEERLARQRDRKKNKGVIEIDDDEPFFSNRKNIIRLVLFVLAVSLAVFFMVKAVNTLIHKDPGWYEIECEVDKSVPYYSSDVTFKYEFTGSSTEIGKLMKEIKNSYSSSLKRYYMLFNAAEEYEDVVNVATVNSSRGEWVTLDETVYRSLKDAYGRKCDAYSVTAGVFNAIRDPIVYSEEPLDADPKFNSVSAEMLSSLFTIMKKDDAATLEFDDAKCAVKLTVSDELVKFMEKWELDCPVLDLGQLRVAYLLDAVAKDLEKGGYTKGYLTTESGLSVLLSGFGRTDLAMYSVIDTEEGELTVVSATFPADGGAASASYRSFRRSGEEYGFYSFEKDGATYYRTPYMSDFDGEEKAFSVLAVSDKGDVVSAAYEALKCLRSAELDADADVTVLVEAIDDRGVIRSTSSDVTYNTGAGFTLE